MPGVSIEGGGDKSYVHTQLVAAVSWTVVHGLGKKPAVTVVDSAETVVQGEVTYVDLDTLIVSFTAAFGGRCFCN